MAAARVRARKRKRAKLPWRLRPIVPGSSMTEGQLRKAARGAARVEYGPKLREQTKTVQEAKGYQHDIGGYYDKYLEQLAEQSGNVQRIGEQANTALRGLQSGITGLSTADLKDIQGAANTDAAARGATAGNQAPLASSAAAIRQAMTGAAASTQATQNAAAARYSDTLAHNVGPGQKLQALAQAAGRVRQARGDRRDTLGQRAAAIAKYKGDVRSQEGQNVAAMQIAGVKASDAAFDRRLKRRSMTETVRSHKAGERLAGQRIDVSKQAAGEKVNAYGYTAAQWARFSPAHRQQIMRQQKAGGGAKGKGPTLTPLQSGKAMTQLTSLKDMATRAKTGKAFIEGHGPMPRADRHAAAKKILGFSPVASKLMHPVLVSAALDAVYDGHLSPATIRRLRQNGYNPREVARTLGTRLGRRGTSQIIAPNTQAYAGHGITVPH